MKKMGLSYKQIGRKLGIDCHKGEVLQVYETLGADVQAIKAPAKVSPPTPLWYFFDSEREVIKKHILPSQADVKQLLPQNRVIDRLGENSAFMLGIYLKVNTIINEEIQSAYNGSSSKSSLGGFKKWDSDLSSCVIQQVYQIQKSVGQASLQLTSDSGIDVGRCVCSAIKTLRFGWKEDPLPHPSFFWGCTRYTPIDAFKHDKGTPVRQTFWNVIGDEVKVANITDKNLRLLHQKTATALTFWDGRDDDEDMLKQAILLYGGNIDFKSSKEVLNALRGISKDLTDSVNERIEPNQNNDNQDNDSEVSDEV